ncbi:alpha/beta hydrolase [soil metagenome]
MATKKRQASTATAGKPIAGSQPLHEAAGLDPQWLDAQYNPIPLLTDPAAYFGAWAAASKDLRQSVDCKLDIAYGNSENANALETLDVFPAAQRNSPLPSPVLVFIHGGYWRGSDKGVHSFLASQLIEAGVTVVMPNYPLCPTASMEQIPLSLTQALKWVYEHIADFGGDPGRITVAGHSAGGHLAAMMLSCHWKKVDAGLPADLVRRALSISGLFELEPFRYAPFLAALVNLTADSVQRLSPARFPAPPAGYVLNAVVGADEPGEFHRQNSLIAERWGDERVPVCESIDGHGHFSILPDLTNTESRLFKLLMQLINGGALGNVHAK